MHFAELADKYKDMNFFPVGTSVSYICRPGYSRHPGLKTSITCLGNQTWSEVEEFCKSESLDIFVLVIGEGEREIYISYTQLPEGKSH